MRLKVTLSYDGSNYFGWQKQTDARSIQGVIEEMLSTLHKHPIEITASGRTDAKVHAVAQVFHFDSDRVIDEERWVAAMNCMLPKDIRVQKVEFVEDEFHARFHSTLKRYDYLVSSHIKDPFLHHYMGMERMHLDLARMQDCATIFLGTHDFTTFTSAKIDPRKSRMKTITRLELVQEEKAIRMIFEGNGFLRYMVRMLAQTLIEVGKHKISKAEVQHMLDSKDKQICRYKADACGLYLVEVQYGGK